MMRICPKCSAYYAEDSSPFCLVDGTPLVNVDPSSDNWSEGARAIEEKENARRKQKRKLKWRRVVMSVTTLLIATMVLCVVVVNGLIYLNLPTPTPTSSPSPTPTPAPSPSPSASPSPTPTPTPVFKISGRVMDANKPLGGVNVKLDGVKAASTTTDANGYYTFSNLPAGGSYTITPASGKIDFTPRNRPINDLRKDESADFSGLVQPEVYKISGRVMDASKPLSGVNIMLKGAKPASATTDANGYYTFSNLPAGGSYTITPVSGTTNFTPPSRSINNLTQDASAHFSALAKHDSTPTQECTDADKSHESKTIINSFGDIWRRKIEGDSKIIARNVRGGVENKASLGRIEYQGTFFKNCMAAAFTARYVWEVTSPVGTTRVPKERTFACVKMGSVWTCR